MQNFITHIEDELERVDTYIANAGIAAMKYKVDSTFLLTAIVMLASKPPLIPLTEYALHVSDLLLSHAHFSVPQTRPDS